MGKKKFQTIAFKKMNLRNRNQKLYRLYSSKDDFKDIEAGTVFEAIEKTEIKKPLNILVLINKLEGTQNNDKLSSQGETYELATKSIDLDQNEQKKYSPVEDKETSDLLGN